MPAKPTVEERSLEIQELKRELHEKEARIEKLQSDYEHFRCLFETTPLGCQFLDESGHFIAVNQAWSDLLGYSPEEVKGKSFSQFSAPDSADAFRYFFSQLREKGRISGIELEMIKKDGSPILISLNGNTGKNRQSHCILQDITSQKSAEKVLKENEEKFRLLASMLPETIYETDLTGKLTFVNKSAFDAFLFSEEEFMSGLNVFDMVIPADRSRLGDNIKRIFNGSDLRVTEYTAVRKGGTTFPAITRSAPIYSENRLIGLRGFLIDVTEQKNMEAHLRQARKMESIGILAGGIAHDFNNILSIIFSGTELAMVNIPEPEQAMEYLVAVRNAGLRARNLIKQLLTFSRKSEIRQTPVDLSPVVRDSLKLLRSTIPSNIEIITNVDGRCFPVRADSTQIHQILMNIITNASQAIEGIGFIRIDLGNIEIHHKQTALIRDLEPGKYVRLTVEDNGSGIDPKVFDKIFDPYFTTKELGKGTGMGLAVVHGIVEFHLGAIVLDSTVGKGTTISLYFPATEEPLEEVLFQNSLPALGHERILIIDDEEQIARLNGKILEMSGYQVTSATDPVKALGLIKSDPGQFDLVITDMTMPRMTGDILTREILKLNPKMRVILYTGYSEKIDEDLTKSLGIKAFLLKPVEAGTLVRNVRTVLDED